MLSEVNRAKLELFLLSALSLVIELLVIRWMSADIRAFTVFRTFPLITCFVGLGVGFSLGKSDSYRLLPISMLAFALMMKIADFLGLGILPFPSFSVFQWQNLTGLITINGAYVAVFLLAIILVLSIPFAMCVAIASRMGVLFNELPTLPAYCYNIVGALCGGIAFSLFSNMRWAPWELLLIPAGLITVLQWSTKRKSAIVGAVSLLIIPVIFLSLPSSPAKPLIPALLKYHSAESTTLWSPYQRIDLTVLESPASQSKPKGEFVGLELSANRAFYQYFFNLQSDSPLQKEDLWKNIRADYALPFAFNKPKSALIVGSGTGQNVTSAVNAGVQDIDAVEIDPVILEIGNKYNPDYQSPAVHQICDDARHFFSRCKKQYDVINFSTLDSHTLAGIGSSVRIDAYVYTKESIREALSLLNKDGIVFISFSTVAPWTEARLFKTFSEAAGYDPIELQGKMVGCIFLLGPAVKAGTIAIPPDYRQLKPNLSGPPPRILTDDWPYLYVQPDLVDYPYLMVVAEILLLSIYAGRKLLFGKTDGSAWQLFFLGAAFMLLELHAISFLSLLYGSTWITSALVINGILLMILAATVLTNRLGTVIDRKQNLIYVLLFAAIGLSFFVSSEGLSDFLRSGNQIAVYVAVTFFTILPMGVAAIVFASALRSSSNASRALAFNLFGAVIGGLLEYLSNYLGIRNLLIVAALLYLCSVIGYLRRPKIC